MTATLSAVDRRATYQRRYQPTEHSYVVVWVWRDQHGPYQWRVTWYGVNMYGVQRFQFRAFGEGRTLREAWCGVRQHYRLYAGGRDIVREREVGR
jgi:hypothetical protein